MNPFKNFAPFKRWTKRDDKPRTAPVVPVVDKPKPNSARDTTNALAFLVVDDAIRKATRGRKTTVASLTGTERRRVRRILERRERRLKGEQVGMIAPSMAAQRKAPSSFRASL